MRDTGGERLTNTSRYIHHAILIPKITATVHILNATPLLTTAIEGTQEAAPDKLQAIKSICMILPGKQPPQQPLPPPTTPRGGTDKIVKNDLLLFLVFK
jgi:hypothetical protein